MEQTITTNLFSPIWLIYREEIVDEEKYNKMEFEESIIKTEIETMQGELKDVKARVKELENLELSELGIQKYVKPPKFKYSYKLYKINI